MTAPTPRAALSAPAGWRPIETAPRDQTVLLWHKHYGRPTVGHWITGDIWGVYVPGTSMLFQPHLKDIPTHWMPLPALPAAPQPKEDEMNDANNGPAETDQVERPVRPAAVVCDRHVSGGAIVRWAGSDIPCPPETQLYTQAALDAAIATARNACASTAWIHYMDVCKARGLAPSEHEHWNAARAVRGA